eukprot:gene24518-biopygen22400
MRCARPRTWKNEFRKKRQRARTGRGPDAGRMAEFKETDADRTRAWPFLPGQPCGISLALGPRTGPQHLCPGWQGPSAGWRVPSGRDGGDQARRCPRLPLCRWRPCPCPPPPPPPPPPRAQKSRAVFGHRGGGGPAVGLVGLGASAAAAAAAAPPLVPTGITGSPVVAGSGQPVPGLGVAEHIFHDRQLLPKEFAPRPRRPAPCPRQCPVTPGTWAIDCTHGRRETRHVCAGSRLTPGSAPTPGRLRLDPAGSDGPHRNAKYDFR